MEDSLPKPKPLSKDEIEKILRADGAVNIDVEAFLQAYLQCRRSQTDPKSLTRFQKLYKDLAKIRPMDLFWSFSALKYPKDLQPELNELVSTQLVPLFVSQVQFETMDLPMQQCFLEFLLHFTVPSELAHIYGSGYCISKL